MISNGEWRVASCSVILRSEATKDLLCLREEQERAHGARDSQ